MTIKTTLKIRIQVLRLFQLESAHFRCPQLQKTTKHQNQRSDYVGARQCRHSHAPLFSRFNSVILVFTVFLLFDVTQHTVFISRYRSKMLYLSFQKVNPNRMLSLSFYLQFYVEKSSLKQNSFKLAGKGRSNQQNVKPSITRPC